MGREREETARRKIHPERLGEVSLLVSMSELTAQAGGGGGGGDEYPSRVGESVSGRRNGLSRFCVMI